jgi:hypothetical protein
MNPLIDGKNRRRTRKQVQTLDFDEVGMLRLLSVNVGLPRDVTWNGKTVRTSVWKSPVDGRRMVRKLDIYGDAQADLAGHGGEHRAVFVYQMDSYDYCESFLGRNDFTFGQFGKNFTVDGLPDNDVCIGDRYRIGSAEFAPWPGECDHETSTAGRGPDAPHAQPRLEDWSTALQDEQLEKGERKCRFRSCKTRGTDYGTQMSWLVRTSKDLGGRPPLASRCISLTWSFFHGDVQTKSPESPLRNSSRD